MSGLSGFKVRELAGSCDLAGTVEHMARALAQAPTAEHKKELLKGFEAAFKGRPLSGLPDELVKEITAAGGGSLALRVRQKDAAAIAA